MRETITYPVVVTTTVRLVPPIPSAGALVIIGGATFPQTYYETINSTGKSRSMIEIIPTTSSTPAETGADYVRIFESYGAEAVLLNVTELNCHETAYDPQYVELVKSLDGVFFTGGDQNRVSKCLLPGRKATPVLEALWLLYVREGVISGNSTGATIMSDPMIGGGSDERVVVTRSLGFLVYGRVIVDQHFLARGRFLRLLEALIMTGVPVGIGIDEDSATVCDGHGNCKVIGSAPSVVVVYEGFNGTHYVFRLHYLTPGDLADLQNLRVWVDPTKSSVLLSPDPEGKVVVADIDIKAQNGLARVIELLINSRKVQVNAVSESKKVWYILVFERSENTSIYSTPYFGHVRYSALNIVLYLERTKT